MKLCTRCKIEKPLDDFHNCKSKKSGKMSQCKDCRNAYNRKKAKEIGHDVLYRRARDRDPEAYKKRRREYYLANKERIKERSREWSKNNPDIKKATRDADYKRNRSRYIESAKRWANNNKEKRREISRNYANRFYNSPENKPIIIARKLLSRILEHTGKKKRGKTFDELGYSRKEFEEHMERLFQDGMSWENHGEWHVDHIIPVSEMVRLGVTCPRKINALSNLRPLWAEDNLGKNNGFDLSVQVNT